MKSHRTLIVIRHQEDNTSKATSFLFPLKMIAIPEEQQNKDQTQNPNKQWEQP